MRTERSGQEPLAIVGIGCRLPGDVGSPESYWDLLCSGTDATRVVPDTRWNAARFHDPHPGKVGKMVTRRGGFLADVDQFDPQFFGISPREAHLLDPQQRLLLQVTWEALEDGGIAADSLAGTPVGVFIGGFTLDYQLLQNQGRTSRYRFKTHSSTGMMMTMLANRLSFAFDFRGPSMTVDTACSSSLVAVHLAAQSIWNGECDVALAGGVNVMLGPNTAIAESKSGFLSPDGRSKAFDESANGYARGEGGAVVVVKTLAQAQLDGDEVYAQILGTAVSQDGHTDGITVPRKEAQEAAIVTALQRAGVRPADVGYVEAHGTGTPVGDPIEMQALAHALASDRPAEEPLLIGSVKTNIGHLEAGAGVAGLIKTALVLKHGFIPANLHFHSASGGLDLAELGIDVPTTGRPFPGGRRRVAGVNSFGFGGTNAHVVLAEPPAAPVNADEAETARVSAPLTILPISARSEEALVATARQLADHLGDHPEVTLDDLAYTLGRRRAHLNHRHTLIADGIADAGHQLQALADGGQIAAGRTNPVTPKLAFVCTGMGPQWWGMCRGLLGVFPVFTESIERTDRELSRYTDWSLLEELRRDEATSRLGETDVAQPANFAIQIALAAQLEAFGVRPDAVVGHSAGEVAAHYLAGLLDFSDAVRVIFHRSRLQQRTSGMGRMLAVGLDAEALMGVLDEPTRDEFHRRVSIAAINSPSSVTIAGDAEVLDDVARQLDDAQVFNRSLAVKVPYHTHYMDLVKDDLFAAFEGLASKPATTPLYSTVTGERLDGYAAGAAYWWQNTRATVMFEPAMRRLLDDGYTHFVELGPHPVLAASIFETAGTEKALVLATQRRNDDDARTLLNCVGALHCNGHDVAWDAVHPGGSARRVKLPSYPWQNRRYWNETPEASEDLHYHPVHPLLGQPVTGVRPTWEVELSASHVPFLADHRVQGSVVVPGAVYVEMALAVAREHYGTDLAVDELRFHRAVILDDSCDPILRTTLDEDDATVEFAAFTATADGDAKWTVTATAALRALPSSPRRREVPGDAEAIPTPGDEFYSRTETLGFDYGEAFRPVTEIVGGDRWSVARLAVPEPIADDIDGYRFHPALVDGAFQTLFGTTLLDHDDTGEQYLPARIAHTAVYGSPEAKMTVEVQVLSATSERIEADITVTNQLGEPLAVFDGFTVESISSSARTSPERLDKGIYEIHWADRESVPDSAVPEPAEDVDQSWLVFVDARGVGAAVAEGLRSRGHRVRTVTHGPVAAVAETGDGYVVNAEHADQVGQVFTAHLDRVGDLSGVVDCWPVDVVADPGDEAVAAANLNLGVFTVMRLVKALARHDSVAPRLYLVTANAQPAPGTASCVADQAAVWGLGRVIGHHEFAERWGGLVDVDPDDADGRAETATRVCDYVLAGDPEDQVAIRGRAVYVPRIRHAEGLTKALPTTLTPDATYVVTGGVGALGRTVATYLAERGARHIVLLSRTAVPPRREWSTLTEDDPRFATVDAIRGVERLGARVSTASVDVTDAAGLRAWLDDHVGDGGWPVRGVIHAAGTVHDQLLMNMSEEDFAKVLAPKMIGTRALHDVFGDHDLEFFVLFGSAGSTIASPGQGNYAAANAYLDAFAHRRQSQGLPALTIGWGPWSVGMVEELHLEKVYAHRGIELITPSAGAKILDRLLNQKTPQVVAITADWGRARQVGFSAGLPRMFAELEATDVAPHQGDSDSSMVEMLNGLPESERLAAVTAQLRRTVAGVFDCAVEDIEPDDVLDDVGLDSMMAMDFRLRINATFAIDLPVLEILRGVSVDSLAVRVLAEVEALHGTNAEDAVAEEPSPVDDGVDELIDALSEDDLRRLLSELEAETAEREPGH
ncbi:type I polyketide synthase [Mycobacterium yunnanensis]|uniref:Type I polyketide synthase n=1 Tax=Mycobacterium yunnanensis TaxID=368477 RepID=A0A9X2Z8M1_9MYCO|nr:type I polyketide synthase [Mycobacterium yunnanensis]MCV7423896.1 type I polyketide synthase [Mycobacterium yunnanensis]